MSTASTLTLADLVANLHQAEAALVAASQPGRPTASGLRRAAMDEVQEARAALEDAMRLLAQDDQATTAQQAA